MVRRAALPQPGLRTGGSVSDRLYRPLEIGGQIRLVLRREIFHVRRADDHRRNPAFFARRRHGQGQPFAKGNGQQNPQDERRARQNARTHPDREGNRGRAAGDAGRSRVCSGSEQTAFLDPRNRVRKRRRSDYADGPDRGRVAGKMVRQTRARRGDRDAVGTRAADRVFALFQGPDPVGSGGPARHLAGASFPPRKENLENDPRPDRSMSVLVFFVHTNGKKGVVAWLPPLRTRRRFTFACENG